MVELKGSLRSIGLMAIVRLVDELHRTGSLQLRAAEHHGTLAFDNGHLVAAECGEHHGLQGLADCVLHLSDADFTFEEGAPSLDRTLDIAPADLEKLIERITSGEFQQHANAAIAAESEALTTCSLLGFADDRARHYSRPTALHRCYAGGQPALVSAAEQGDLCLSGRFATCPRFRTADRAKPAAADPVPSAPAQRAAPAHPPMPAGVASRLSTAASQLHVEPPARKQALVQDESNVAPRPKRRVVLVVAAAVLGVLLVGAIVFFVVAALRGARPSPTSAADVVPVNRPTAALTAVATAARVTAPAPAPSAIARAPTLTPPPRPTPIPTAGRPLLDLRFATGPAQGWLDNPPYAAWSAGAYRMQAHDATRFVAAGVPINESMSDVIVSATFRKTGGPPGGGYGLIVRDQGPEPRDGVNQQMSAYVFETGDLGDFGIWRREDDRWVDLVPWTHSASVRSGGSPNDLVVRARGDELTFSVNGAEVATVHDDVLAAGGVGLFVGGDDNEVALDQFSVHIPDE